jgi:RNA polymerase sigma factor (sigma-70 family)
MSERQPDETSATLLGQLRTERHDAAAWQEFVRRYRPRIFAFCIACRLQPADAEDVTQSVLCKLIVKMRDFQYDSKQSFRAWLKTVTRNVLNDFLDERREPASGDSVVFRLLENVEAREELAQQIQAEFDQELFDAALQRVRERVPAHQWDAFRLTALEGISGAAAAAQLKMLVGSVYTAKSRVQKMIRDEIDYLDRRAG